MASLTNVQRVYQWEKDFKGNSRLRTPVESYQRVFYGSYAI